MSSNNPRRFKDLRKAQSPDLPRVRKNAKDLLGSLGGTMAGNHLENFLAAELLAVCPDNSYEALLEDRGRKALAQELLNMIEQDGPKNETLSKPTK